MSFQKERQECEHDDLFTGMQFALTVLPSPTLLLQPGEKRLETQRLGITANLCSVWRLITKCCRLYGRNGRSLRPVANCSCVRADRAGRSNNRGHAPASRAVQNGSRYTRTGLPVSRPFRTVLGILFSSIDYRSLQHLA